MSSGIHFAVVSMLLIGNTSARAQEASPMPTPLERNQFTLDLNVAGATLGYARRATGERSWGVAVGLGGDLLNATVLSGRHFGETGWLAYEARDSGGGEYLFEVAHAEVFTRCCTGARWQLDLGLRASAFMHWDDSDDEGAGASFVGVALSPTWGGQHLRVGPRLLLGVLSEGRPEFAINVGLLTGRLMFTW